MREDWLVLCLDGGGCERTMARGVEDHSELRDMLGDGVA
jgi:hypothetical protein